MAHLNLVMIHPFRDGNGRMSRCLQTLVLAREQILAQDLCSIEEYLGRNTDAYYQILAEVGRGRWRPEGDALPWVRFCLTAHYVQAMSVLRRIRESQQLWLKLDELRLRHQLQERTLAALYDAAVGLRVRNTTYRTILRNQWQQDISSQVATLDLGAMVKVGLLDVHGSKRTTTYTAGEDVTVVAASVQRDRQPISADGLFAPDTGLSEPTLPLGE
jgi:Fic family protein